MTDSYVIAKGAPRPIVYAKWLHSLRKGNDYFKLIDHEAYYRTYHAYLERIVTAPDTVIRYAVLSDDPDVILGFSVAQRNLLHYVFVSPEVRGQKIGTALIPDDVNIITHLTRTGLIIFASKYSGKRDRTFIFNPFAT